MGFLPSSSLAIVGRFAAHTWNSLSRWRRALVCIAATAISLSVPAALSGCAGVDDVRAVRDDALQVREQLTAQIAAADAAIAQQDQLGLAADAPERVALERAKEQALATRQAVDAAITQVDLILKEAQDPTDPLSMASRQLAPLVPGPWQAPLILAGALAAVFLRSQQLKTALLSVAHGIEVAKDRDPLFKDAFAKHADLFRIEQTATARRVVDEITAK
jgi:hypothetical protein